jgi:hypothetical protein
MPIDMTAAKAPPRRARAVKAPVMVQPEQTARSLREEGLQGLGALVQGVMNMAGQYADAGAIGMYFPGMSTEVAKLADVYEVIAKPVDLIIKVGPFGALIALGMPLVMQIAANHKLVDASRMLGSSVVPPEVLEAQMKAHIMRQQAEAQREQAAALQEAQAAQAEYQKILSQITPQNVEPSVNGKTSEYPTVAV